MNDQMYISVWKCTYPKNKPTKNARKNGNLRKRTSELRERAINSKKRSHCHLFWEECRKGFNLCWIYKEYIRQSQNQSRHHKRYNFEGVLHIRGACFHGFRTSDQMGYTCVGPENIRWQRALRSLNRVPGWEQIHLNTGHYYALS